MHSFNEEETLRCFALCVFALPNSITLLTVSKAKRENSLYQTLCKDYHKIQSFQFHEENIEFWLKFIFANGRLQTGKGSQIPWVWTQAVSSAGVFDEACCCSRLQKEPPAHVLHRGAHTRHTLWVSTETREAALTETCTAQAAQAYFFLLADKGWCLPAELRRSPSFDW